MMGSLSACLPVRLSWLQPVRNRQGDKQSKAIKDVGTNVKD